MDPYAHLFRPEDRRAKAVGASVAVGVHLLVLVAALLWVLPAPEPVIERSDPIDVGHTFLPPPKPPEIIHREIPETPPRQFLPAPDAERAEPIVDDHPVIVPVVDGPVDPDLWQSREISGPTLPPGPTHFAVVSVKPGLIDGTRVEPDYPEVCRRVGAEGRVILQVVIGRDGTVEPRAVLAEPRVACGFVEAATEAVTRWRYTPGRHGGRAVEVLMTVVLDFVLD